jgi:hypothetical protein
LERPGRGAADPVRRSRRAAPSLAGSLLTGVALVVLLLVDVGGMEGLQRTDGGPSAAGEVSLPLDADLPVAATTGVGCIEVAACTSWERRLDAFDASRIAVAVGPDAVAVAQPQGILLLDPWTGAVRWSSATDLSMPPSVQLAGGLVVATGARGELVVLHLDDGTPVAGRTVPAALGGTGPLLAARRYADRLAVVRDLGTGAQQLAVIDLVTGTATARSRTAGQVLLARSGPVLLRPGDTIAAQDPATSVVLWELPLASAPVAASVVGDALVLVGGDTALVLDAMTGRPTGTVTTSQQRGLIERPGEGLLLPAGRSVSFVGRDGSVWTSPIAGGGCCRGMSLEEDVVTVLLLDGRLARLSRSDGTVLGWTSLGRGSSTRDAAAAPQGDGRAVDVVPAVGASTLHDGMLLAVRRTDDAPTWSVVDARTGATIATVEAEGRVAGSTRSGALIVLTGEGIAAIPRSSGADPPRRVGAARRCSSAAPGGCTFGG